MGSSSARRQQWAPRALVQSPGATSQQTCGGAQLPGYIQGPQGAGYQGWGRKGSRTPPLCGQPKSYPWCARTSHPRRRAQELCIPFPRFLKSQDENATQQTRSIRFAHRGQKGESSSSPLPATLGAQGSSPRRGRRVAPVRRQRLGTVLRQRQPGLPLPTRPEWATAGKQQNRRPRRRDARVRTGSMRGDGVTQETRGGGASDRPSWARVDGGLRARGAASRHCLDPRSEVGVSNPILGWARQNPERAGVSVTVAPGDRGVTHGDEVRGEPRPRAQPAAPGLVI